MTLYSEFNWRSIPLYVAYSSTHDYFELISASVMDDGEETPYNFTDMLNNETYAEFVDDLKDFLSLGKTN